MKKIYYIFIFLFTFFVVNLRVNAYVPLCIYSGSSFWNTEAKPAFIMIEGHNVVVTFDSSLGAVGDISESLLQIGVFSGLGGALGFGYSMNNVDLTNRLPNIISGSKAYGIVSNGDHAVEYMTINDENADEISVEWEPNSLNSNFYGHGYCPPIVVEDADGGVFDYPSIIFADNYDQSGISGVFDQLVNQNRVYYLHYELFSENPDVSVSEVSSCITDESTIAKYYTLFHFPTYDNGESVYTEEEKIYVRDLYIKNGYDEIADAIIENYSSTSTCVSQNPSLSSYYQQMYQAAFDFKTATSDEMIMGDVDCDGIIGDPSNTGSFAYYLNMSIKFIQYIGPILVIVFTIIEYFKALVAGDQDALKKANSRTVTRLIFAILLFLLPVIINTLLHIFHIYSDCSIVTNR